MLVLLRLRLRRRVYLNIAYKQLLPCARSCSFTLALGRIRARSADKRRFDI